ncbi:MAG: tetratricopeptide repeat protein, partial [Deltaproteobacteria bacterium]|nr:tetratricopeptide repeat protein [Deltaproteobacteria bacterium]
MNRPWNKRWIILVALIVILSLGLSSTTTAEAKDWKQYMVEGTEAVEKKNYKDAIESMNAALNIATNESNDSQRATSLMAIGLCYYLQDQSEKALECYDNSLT